MYKKGKGVKQDDLKALKFSQKACFNALAFFIHKSKIRATTARIQITRLLGKLERLEQDNFKALKFFQKACDLNYGGGCFNLGLSYKEGKGVKQDDFKEITRLLGKLECLEIILFNALAFFIHKSKIRATTAIIQITRLLEKLGLNLSALVKNKWVKTH
jgi:TPR repeat protein